LVVIRFFRSLPSLAILEQTPTSSWYLGWLIARLLFNQKSHAPSAGSFHIAAVHQCNIADIDALLPEINKYRLSIVRTNTLSLEI